MMELIEELPCETTEQFVFLSLYSNVSNAAKLRSMATSGQLKAALLEPTNFGTHFKLFTQYIHTYIC